MAAVNELVQKVKERTGQKKTKMAPDSQVLKAAIATVKIYTVSLCLLLFVSHTLVY